MKLRKLQVILFLGAILPWNASVVQASLTKKDRPNIIYILADNLGIGDLGCYGQQVIETPYIDALAKDGIIFTNHYAGQTVSTSSRSILLTGQHSGHAYLRDNDEMEERGEVWNHRAMLADSTLEGQRALPANTVMIPRLLRKGGYVSACIGQWGLGYPGSESTPNKMGFDYFYGYNCMRQAQTYFPPFLYRNECRVYQNNQYLEPGTRLDKNENPYDALNYTKYTQQDYAPDNIYKEVLHFIDLHRSQPFALFWMSPLVHGSLQAPEKWVKHYRKKIGDEAPYLGGQGFFPCRYPKATYAAMVSYLDQQIGGLVQHLKELGLYENTLIVFTSSNGPSCEGGVDVSYFRSTAPHRNLKGWGKGSLREGGIHVPMVVCWPKEIEAGTKSDLLSAFWDALPTLCEIAEVEAPVTDGISFLPTLKGKKRKQKLHDYLYWEYPGAEGQKALRMGSWKAFVGNILKGNRQVQLFDMAADPQELHDVSSQYPNVVKQMKEVFKEAHSTPKVKAFSLPAEI